MNKSMDNLPPMDFIMQLTDGYSFRNVITIIKSETGVATMALSPYKIEISFINNSGCAIHKILIRTEELTLYNYDARDPQDPNRLLDEYPIAFDTNELCNNTKGVGRKDGIRLYRLRGDNRINVQPIKNVKDPGKAGALFVSIHNIEYVRYDIENIYPINANVKVQAKDFADLCAGAAVIKCSALDIIGKPNSVRFRGVLPNNNEAFITDFASPNRKTNLNQPDFSQIDSLLSSIPKYGETSAVPAGTRTLNIIKNDELANIRVPIATVKAISKIHNISPPGSLLRLFFVNDKPIKIESVVGSYGTYTICIKDSRAPQASKIMADG